MNHVAALLSRLQQVRPRGQHNWTACCPAHGDLSPSLSVSIGDKGQVLLHCHAGCGAAEVVGALGLDFADLYPPDTQFKKSGRGLQSGRPPLPGWARPGSQERLRESVAALFLLCAAAYSPGTPERDKAAAAMAEASQILGGAI